MLGTDGERSVTSWLRRHSCNVTNEYTNRCVFVDVTVALGVVLRQELSRNPNNNPIISYNLIRVRFACLVGCLQDHSQKRLFRFYQMMEITIMSVKKGSSQVSSPEKVE